MGCLVCLWVGLLGVPVGRVAWCARGRRPAREIATREPDGSEWSISKPGQAPPPPTAAAARPRLEAWPGPSGGDLKYQRIRPSSALPVLSPVREIIRPAWLVACLCAKKFALQARKRRKTPFLGVLGELFRGTAVERGAGRVLYRVWHWARYKVLPARLLGGASGTKFSLLGQNRLKWAILGVLGEFCTGWAAGVGVLGEFCAGFGTGRGTKFSLLGFLVVRAVQSSPCSCKTG